MVLSWCEFIGVVAVGLALTSGCAVRSSARHDVAVSTDQPGAKSANVEDDTPESRAAFEVLRRSFVARNPAYDLRLRAQATQLNATPLPRIVFVQKGTGTAELNGKVRSTIDVGDIIMIAAGSSLSIDTPVDLVVFQVPDPFPAEIPAFIRPDWDENITDVPGGCATEEGAYRRILLTWLTSNGTYIYHALNAHRVRITDSFSHYHPIEGGFDEFYLVQMARPESKLIVSRHTAMIEHPETMSREMTSDLLEEIPLRVGDLIYLPRGLMHRGVGGALVQVITIPGFKPGAEIGVDHHLRKINETLGLEGDDALPYHEAASLEPVIR